MSLITTPGQAVAISDLAAATADLNVADLLAILSASGVNRKLTIGALAEAMRKSSVVTSSFTIIAAGWRREETYALSASAVAAATATLPSLASVPVGTRYTFKNKNTSYTFTAACAESDTIGTTGSASFILYSRDDYVALESDGEKWIVVASSAPRIASAQTAAISVQSQSWTAVGSGLTLSIPAGVYDVDVQATLANSGSTDGVPSGAIMVAGTPQTARLSGGASSPSILHLSERIQIAATSTVCLGLRTTSAGAIASIPYSSGVSVGEISARRIG